MPGIGFGVRAAAGSGGVASPTVYTLTLDDLSTRFAEYIDATASINFTLTTEAGTTTNIFLDESNGSGNAIGFVASETTLATRIHDSLEALTGYTGKVTVGGASSEAGDKYDFTITFDASLGAVTLNFGTSQWYPTIALVETVDSDGVSDDPGPGSPEVHTITPHPVNPTGGTWKPGSDGSAILYDDGSPENQAFVAGSWVTVNRTGGSNLGSGAIQFTNGQNGDVDVLGPVNVDLTAPEITHSIT